MSPNLPNGRVSISDLRRELTPLLSERFFQRSPIRVIYFLSATGLLIVHMVITNAAIRHDLPWSVWLLSLLVVGNTSAFFFLFFHELLHGAVLPRGSFHILLAYLSGLPVLCSPRIWRTWHSIHHATTAGAKDPDRARHEDFDDFEDLFVKIQHFFKRFHLSDLVSYVVPFGVIAGHHLYMFIDLTFRRKQTRIARIIAVLEYTSIIVIFLVPLFVFGPKISIAGIYAPVFLGQLICNLYIISNHNNALLTKVNMPLLNSTSVYLIDGFRITHMGFGRHVEHHIFPEVAHNRLREITPLLRSRYRDTFVEACLFDVLKTVYTRKRPFQTIT
jgi:fatty acid desaturase